MVVRATRVNADDIALFAEAVELVQGLVPSPIVHHLVNDLRRSLAQPVLLAPRDAAVRLVEEWMATPATVDVLGPVLQRLHALLGDSTATTISGSLGAQY